MEDFDDGDDRGSAMSAAASERRALLSELDQLVSEERNPRTMGIDPIEALSPYVDRVAHAQAKDIEVFPERRNRYGWPGRAVERPDPWDVGWWRYRVPGLGQVDWNRVVDTLYEGGFDVVLSVEHEDPVWGGTEERIETGLRVAHRTLRPLIVA